MAQKEVRCGYCNGTGQNGTSICPSCGGIGCPNCGINGTVPSTCSHCSGRGYFLEWDYENDYRASSNSSTPSYHGSSYSGGSYNGSSSESWSKLQGLCAVIFAILGGAVAAQMGGVIAMAIGGIIGGVIGLFLGKLLENILLAILGFIWDHPFITAIIILIVCFIIGSKFL